MFRNYLVTALRNIERNRLYAAISILGLAVAFAVAILIGQFARNELTYDTWIPGHQYVYKITTRLQQPARSPYLLDKWGASSKGLFEEAFPHGGMFTLLAEELPVMRHRPGDAGINEPSFAWADPNVFQVFPVPALAGDLRSALQQPDTVVITRRIARKYFGRDLPLGDTLEFQDSKGHSHVLRVTGVLKDFPYNTDLTTEVFASNRSAYSPVHRAVTPSEPEAMGHIFIRLSPKASVSELQRAMTIAIRPEVAMYKGAYGDATTVSAELIQLPEMHFTPPTFPPQVVKPSGNRSVAYGAAGIGAMIVLVAAINFVTLMTARAGRRGVEVGVRKATGARRSDLIVQFIGEALLQAALSLFIGAALAEVLLGPFNAFVQRDLAMDFVHDPLLLAGIIGLGLGVGLLASIYPALVLSNFRPMVVLKGGIIPSSSSPIARQGLVVVQFAVLIGLILSTATLYRQTAFALTKGLGTVDARRIVNVFTPCGNAFGQEVRKLPGVAAVACSSELSLNLPNWQDATPVQIPGGNRTFFTWGHVDFDFFKLYGVKPVAGRLFSPKYGEDTLQYDPARTAEPSVVVNETGARLLGFADPRKAVGQRFVNFFKKNDGFGYTPHSSVIVGVVPDMPMNVRSAANPTYYYIMPHMDVLSISMAGKDIPGTLKAIGATWKRTGNAKPIDEVFPAQARQAINHDLIVQRTIVAAGAGLAALIACLGLFALSAYTTERRTKEIGVRKVMGADTRQVVMLLLWQFTIPVLIATSVAIPLGFMVMNWWLHGFAYHVDLTAWTFVLAAVAAVGIAWGTVSWQSFTVARAKPASALRYE